MPKSSVKITWKGLRENMLYSQKTLPIVVILSVKMFKQINVHQY